uniref:Uncharacterized protein n=1 Tax=Anopheles dirus TaxID=7168 RepID=A0A182N304_9DIPT
MLLLRSRSVHLFLVLDVVQSVSLARYKIIPFVTHANVTNNSAFINATVEIIATASENRINFDFTVAQPIYGPRLTVVLWLDLAAGALQAPFYNQTIDVCSLLKNPGAHRMVLLVYRELRRHGTLPTGCPIPVGLYKFRGISTNQMRLPPFFTQSDFMVDIIGLTSMTKAHTIDTRWYGVINYVKCIAADRC